MIELSRRGFMQLSGLGATLALPFPFRAMLGEQVRVRLLEPVVLRSEPQTSAKYLQQLHPDTVHVGALYNQDWLRLPGGYIPLESVQYMLPLAHSDVTRIPVATWVEVIAPYVAVRAYAAPTAPLVVRANHGDVFCLTHSFCDDKGVWWAQSSSGWLQAGHVRRIPQHVAANGLHHLTVALSPRTQSIEVTDQHHRLAALAAVISPDVPDVLNIEAFVPGMYHGRPWNVIMGKEWVLHGEGSHNLFGKSTRCAAPNCVELSTLAARWLYHLMQSAERVSIRVNR